MWIPIIWLAVRTSNAMIYIKLTTAIHNILHVQTVQRVSIIRCVDWPQIEIMNDFNRFIIHNFLIMTHSSCTHYRVHTCYTELWAHSCELITQLQYCKQYIYKKWPNYVWTTTLPHAPHHQITSSVWIRSSTICMSKKLVKLLLFLQGIMSFCFSCNFALFRRENEQYEYILRCKYCKNPIREDSNVYM